MNSTADHPNLLENAYSKYKLKHVLVQKYFKWWFGQGKESSYYREMDSIISKGEGWILFFSELYIFESSMHDLSRDKQGLLFTRFMSVLCAHIHTLI